MRTRNARINTLRGILREFGIVVPTGPAAAIRHATEALTHLPSIITPALCAVIDDVHNLEQQMKTIERQLRAEVKADPVLQNFIKISGIGLLTATATRAAVQSLEQFNNGRQFSAWLGLTPREYSSGNHRYLGRISKRGGQISSYPVCSRGPFCHGAL